MLHDCGCHFSKRVTAPDTLPAMQKAVRTDGVPERRVDKFEKKPLLRHRRVSTFAFPRLSRRFGVARVYFAAAVASRERVRETTNDYINIRIPEKSGKRAEKEKKNDGGNFILTTVGETFVSRYAKSRSEATHPPANRSGMRMTVL